MTANRDQDMNTVNDKKAHLNEGYQVIYKESKAIKKQPKSKGIKSARRRVDDYLERKAFNDQMKEWDISFDF